MLKVKRALPKVMLDADARVEQWRGELLRAVHERLDVAIYLLTTTACRSIGNAAARLIPHNFADFEYLVRDRLFGLQFALTGLAGERADGEFDEEGAVRSVTSADVARGLEAIRHMSDWAHARDAYLTYQWGGYELEGSAVHLVFRDAEGWFGARDRAEQVLRNEIEKEWAESVRPASKTPLYSLSRQGIDIAPTTSLGGITAEEFAGAWSELARAAYESFLQGGVPVTTRETLVSSIRSGLRLELSQAQRVVDLLTLGSKESVLTLFHCPLVPVTKSSLLVVPPGFVLSNPITCISRLAVRRGTGLGPYSREMEARLLDKLREHFLVPGVAIETRLDYRSSGDRGDVDLVVYESSTNRLLLAMLKAFILPDSVEEVMHANHCLVEGIRQVQRAERWLTAIPFKQWKTRLRIPVGTTPPAVRLAVLGNGFVGSEFVRPPGGISMADVRYLLLPRLKGLSILDAITAYENRLAEDGRTAEREVRVETLQLGEVRIEIPSWTVQI